MFGRTVERKLVAVLHRIYPCHARVKEDHMSRYVLALSMALGFAIALHAQETTTRTTTKVKGDKGKTVTYTGCVQTGTETKSYILDKVVPVGQTTTVGPTGTTLTTTTYALVPGERVELQQFVGHKVEVTGMMIPAGEHKTETKKKIEREGAPDTNVKQTTKTDHAMPDFQVTSVKHLADTCS